jgi:hypothetical protein
VKNILAAPTTDGLGVDKIAPPPYFIHGSFCVPRVLRLFSRRVFQQTARDPE